MSKNLDALLSTLREIHPDIKQIPVDMVVVADWVRFRCRYGCRAYGKHLCCPPFAPTPEETRRVLAEYELAIIARFPTKPDPGRTPEHLHHYFWGSITELHRTIFELERAAFLSGYYKAFGMGAMPCTLCESCVIEDKLEKGEAPDALETIRCRHKDVMRPSMEACGIDVFQTLRNAGYDLKVIKSYSERVELFGMVLLE
jgi:predicted metal-binding protein